jgi:chemotaxis protein methyltransferase CheR
VSFQYHNLVAHPFPSFATGLFGFDVILCRNVLIYFDAAVVARLVEQFRGALADGGWLLVGHAEPQTETFRSFRALLTAHATLYQKVPEGAPGPPPGPEREPLPPPQQQLRGEPAPVTHPPPATGAAPVAPPPPAMVPAPAVAPARSDGGLAVVRRLGDEGRLREALELCDELLGELGLEPAAHFHRALLLEQLGRDGEAEEALRKTLYLDRRFALAHFHRALLLQRRGARPAARRAFGDALRTLAGRRAGERLLATEPLTVADLRSMAATQLALLEAP